MKKYKVMAIVAYIIATVVTISSLVSGKVAFLGLASSLFLVGALLSIRGDDIEREQEREKK